MAVTMNNRRFNVIASGKELCLRAIVRSARLVNAEDPDAMSFLDPQNKRRLVRALEIVRSGIRLADARKSAPLYDVQKVGIFWDRDVLRNRIWNRLERRLEEGMIEEVQGLIKLGVSREFLQAIGLEYRFILNYLVTC